MFVVINLCLWLLLFTVLNCGFIVFEAVIRVGLLGFAVLICLCWVLVFCWIYVLLIWCFDLVIGCLLNVVCLLYAWLRYLIVYIKVITWCICLLLLSSCVLMFFCCEFGVLVGGLLCLLLVTCSVGIWVVFEVVFIITFALWLFILMIAWLICWFWVLCWFYACFEDACLFCLFLMFGFVVLCCLVVFVFCGLLCNWWVCGGFVGVYTYWFGMFWFGFWRCGVACLIVVACYVFWVIWVTCNWGCWVWLSANCVFRCYFDFGCFLLVDVHLNMLVFLLVVCVCYLGQLF